MRTSVMSKADKVEQTWRGTVFEPYLSAFRFDSQVRNLTPKTLDCYLERLGDLFVSLQEQGKSLPEVDKATVQGYALSLKGRVSDETINGRIRVYRRFFGFLVDKGLWESDNPMTGVKLLKTAKKVKPVVDPETVQKIVAGISRDSFEGMRNLLMVLLLWDGMMRKNEMLGLKVSDINLNDHLAKVFGKGRKERMVPLGVKTLKVHHQHLIRWRSKYPGDHLICMRNGEPLTGRHCHKVIQDLGKRHGIVLYPHLLRHSAATWYIRQGGNPAVLQGILGRTSLLVTQNYLHLSSQDAVNSHAQFSPSNCLRV